MNQTNLMLSPNNDKQYQVSPISLSNVKLTWLKKTLLGLIMFFNAIIVWGQYQDDFVLGFKAGFGYTGISNINSMFYPQDRFDHSTYNTKSDNVFGPVVGVFLHYNVYDSYLALQPEVLFSRQGSKYSYSDKQGYNCKISFLYNYLSVGILFCGQLPKFGGMSLKVGPKIGFVLNPQGISYSSASDIYGTSSELTQGYKNVIKGRTDIALGAGLAYEFKFGLNIEAMYYWGVSDAIQTEYNNYDFIDNGNHTNNFQFTVGYVIPMN